MKQAIIGMLSVLAAMVLSGCNRGPQVGDVPAQPGESYRGSLEPLDAYRGKELAKLNEAQAKDLLATIKKLVPGREYRHWFDYRPWHVWEFPNKGQIILVLFEVDNTRPHPSSTGIRLTVFEKTGNGLNESEFSTGHRCYMGAVSLEKQANGQDPLIVLETGAGAGPGPDVQKQYYARIGNRFDLVRLEDSGGWATRNTYYVNHFACGPAVPKQTSKEWETDLLSEDRMRVLRTLVWLGGVHWDGTLPDKSDQQSEATEHIELVRSVRANKKVAEKLRILATADDRWVSEAAVLAANPKDRLWMVGP